MGKVFGGVVADICSEPQLSPLFVNQCLWKLSSVFSQWRLPLRKGVILGSGVQKVQEVIRRHVNKRGNLKTVHIDARAVQELGYSIWLIQQINHIIIDEF